MLKNSQLLKTELTVTLWLSTRDLNPSIGLVWTCGVTTNKISTTTWKQLEKYNIL